MGTDFCTADLYDQAPEEVQVCALPFKSYGRPPIFMGRCATLRTPAHHWPLYAMLDRPGEGRVLVVDAGGDLSIGVLGDKLATLGRLRGWAGVVLYGTIRDARQLAQIDMGVRALGTTARRAWGDAPPAEIDAPLEFGGISVRPGDWIYADEDAVIVAPRDLTVDSSAH